MGEGVAVLPIMVLTGGLHPKQVPFSGFRQIKSQGFKMTKIYERAAKSVILLKYFEQMTSVYMHLKLTLYISFPFVMFSQYIIRLYTGY